MSSSIKLLAVAVLVLFALSSVQNAFAVTELAYDNGTFDGAVSYVNLIAVRFVLADFGFSGSVLLLKVAFNFYISHEPDAVRIHVFASDGVTPLCCTPNLDQTFPNGWNEIDLSSRMTAPIAGAFYVAYEPLGQYSPGISYDNAAPVGHSYRGVPGAWTSYDQNFMIRAYVDPSSVIPEYPLGLPLLAIFMVISYGLIRRKTSTKKP